MIVRRGTRTSRNLLTPSVKFRSRSSTRQSSPTIHIISPPSILRLWSDVNVAQTHKHKHYIILLSYNICVLGLSPSSFAYIRILIYKVFHSVYTIYTVYVNINYVSHQYHSFIHLVLYLSVQRIVNEVRAVYLTLFHNQIIGAIHYDNIVSHHNIYRLCTSHMIKSSSIIQDTLNHNITIYILIICILSYILS